MTTKTKTKSIPPVRYVQTFQTQDLTRSAKHSVCSICKQNKEDLVVANGCQTTTFLAPHLVCRTCLFDSNGKAGTTKTEE